MKKILLWLRILPTKKELLARIRREQESNAGSLQIIDDLSQRIAKLQAFRSGMVTALEYIAWADKTKPYELSRAHKGQMPPIGQRFFTPAEKALQILEKMKEHAEILK